MGYFTYRLLWMDGDDRQTRITTAPRIQRWQNRLLKSGFCVHRAQYLDRRRRHRPRRAGRPAAIIRPGDRMRQRRVALPRGLAQRQADRSGVHAIVRGM